MKIKDLQSEEYNLVTTDYLIADIIRDYKLEKQFEVFDGAIVRCCEGHYKEVYMFHGCVPYLEKEVVRVA